MVMVPRQFQHFFTKISLDLHDFSIVLLNFSNQRVQKRIKDSEIKQQ